MWFHFLSGATETLSHKHIWSAPKSLCVSSALHVFHASNFSLVMPTICLKVGCVTAASYMGALVAFSVSPTIMRSTGGWEAVFYAFGGASLLLLPAWVLLPLGKPKGDSRQ